MAASGFQRASPEMRRGRLNDKIGAFEKAIIA